MLNGAVIIMNIDKPLKVVVDNYDPFLFLKPLDINLIHPTPLSSRYSTIAQKMLGGHCGHNLWYKVLGMTAGGATGLITTFIAVAETVASLAYATLATLVHTLSFCRFSSLQNHVIKSWAYCRHSFIMIWTPIILFGNIKNNSIYEIELRENFFKINSAQAAQSIGQIFDFFARRNEKVGGLDPAKIRSIEVAIEGLTSLINDIKSHMPIQKDPDNNFKFIYPAALPTFTQTDFVYFLRNFNNVKNSLFYNEYFTRVSHPQFPTFVERVTMAMVLHNHQLNQQREDLSCAQEKVDPVKKVQRRPQKKPKPIPPKRPNLPPQQLLYANDKLRENHQNVLNAVRQDGKALAKNQGAINPQPEIDKNLPVVPPIYPGEAVLAPDPATAVQPPAGAEALIGRNKESDEGVEEVEEAEAVDEFDYGLGQQALVEFIPDDKQFDYPDKIVDPSIQAYYKVVENFVKTAVTKILSNPEYVKIYPLEELDPELTREENLRDSISEFLTSLDPVLMLATLQELIELNKPGKLNQCPDKIFIRRDINDSSDRTFIDEALETYKEIINNKDVKVVDQDKKILMGLIVEKPPVIKIEADIDAHRKTNIEKAYNLISAFENPKEFIIAIEAAIENKKRLIQRKVVIDQALEAYKKIKSLSPEFAEGDEKRLIQKILQGTAYNFDDINEVRQANLKGISSLIQELQLSLHIKEIGAAIPQAVAEFEANFPNRAYNLYIRLANDKLKKILIRMIKENPEYIDKVNIQESEKQELKTLYDLFKKLPNPLAYMKRFDDLGVS